VNYAKSTRSNDTNVPVQAKKNTGAGLLDNRASTAQLRAMQHLMQDAGTTQLAALEEPLQGKFEPVQRVQEEEQK